jgi:hypothetical protein
MGYDIKYILFDIQCLVIFCLFIVTIHKIKALFRSNLKYFIIYNFIAFFVMISLFLHLHQYRSNSLSNNINDFSLIFGFSFLSLFIIKNKNSKSFNVVMYFIFIFCLFWIIYNLFFNKKIKGFELSSLIFSINHFGLLLLSTIYFLIKYFSNSEDFYEKDSVYYIILGINICSVINFPYILFVNDFISFDKSITGSSIIINSLGCIGFLIMYSFFIKSISCLK